MRTTLLLLGWLLASPLAAAEAAKPATFEVRLVLDAAASDSEDLAAPPQGVEETLHVQKTALLDGGDLQVAEVQNDAYSGALEIQLTFTAEGAKRLAAVTRQHTGQRLALVIDGKVYSALKVMAAISEGKAVISGRFSPEEARELAAKLNAGGAR